MDESGLDRLWTEYRDAERFLKRFKAGALPDTSLLTPCQRRLKSIADRAKDLGGSGADLRAHALALMYTIERGRYGMLWKQ